MVISELQKVRKLAMACAVGALGAQMMVSEMEDSEPHSGRLTNTNPIPSPSSVVGIRLSRCGLAFQSYRDKDLDEGRGAATTKTGVGIQRKLTPAKKPEKKPNKIVAAIGSFFNSNGKKNPKNLKSKKATKDMKAELEREMSSMSMIVDANPNGLTNLNGLNPTVNPLPEDSEVLNADRIFKNAHIEQGRRVSGSSTEDNVINFLSTAGTNEAVRYKSGGSGGSGNGNSFGNGSSFENFGKTFSYKEGIPTANSGPGGMHKFNTGTHIKRTGSAEDQAMEDFTKRFGDMKLKKEERAEDSQPVEMIQPKIQKTINSESLGNLTSNREEDVEMTQPKEAIHLNRDNDTIQSAEMIQPKNMVKSKDTIQPQAFKFPVENVEQPMQVSTKKEVPLTAAAASKRPRAAAPNRTRALNPQKNLPQKNGLPRKNGLPQKNLKPQTLVLPSGEAVKLGVQNFKMGDYLTADPKRMSSGTIEWNNNRFHPAHGFLNPKSKIGANSFVNWEDYGNQRHRFEFLGHDIARKQHKGINYSHMMGPDGRQTRYHHPREVERYTDYEYRKYVHEKERGREMSPFREGPFPVEENGDGSPLKEGASPAEEGQEEDYQ